MAKAKEIVGLDCGASARLGIHLVLLSRFEEMCSYRAAALDWSDVEGVHDMRVASRRLRSALRDFQPYLRQRKLRHAENGVKLIADALGSVRDEDVAIMALEKLAAESPAQISDGVTLFADERRMKREGARSELIEAIAEDELARLEEEFKDSLERALKVSRNRRNDEIRVIEGLSFQRAGREIISARLRELQQLSASLYRPLKVKPLHRMRIEAKRLRYATELFDSCWNERLAPFAKEIAKLQTSLGELHDCDMWIEDLGAALKDLGVEADEAAQKTQKRSSAIWLLNYFVKERAAHYTDALARWHEWEETGFQADLTRTLND